MSYPRQPNALAGLTAAKRLPPQAVRTYEVDRPRDTHSRPASCVEVACQAHAMGWETLADERTPVGRQIAAQVREVARPIDVRLAPAVARLRRYIETTDPDGRTRFVFPAGQRCFAAHTVEIERPSLYIVRDGDHRGNPRRTPPRLHQNGADWVEDSALHQQALVAAQQKG